MNISELIMFVLYILLMLAIGIFFFNRNKSAGEKDYFLGGRQMGAWVSGLSAGASDMSAWVLMGLPASIYAAGLGQTWIAIGLFIGYMLSWVLVAPRLRAFSVVCDDSITIPQFLTNRFLSKNRSLQAISAIIFLVAYTVYAASSIKACGTLFNTVLGVDARPAMYFAAVIIVIVIFVPVSPSGTGKTLSSFIQPFLDSRALAPVKNILESVFASIVFELTSEYPP